MVAYLVQKLGKETANSKEAIATLQRYLKKIQVRKVRVSDFTPSKRTLEASDIDKVVTEFRAFLEDALTAGDDELPVIELE